MRKVTNEEHKHILLNMLKYFDSFCRDNNIKYTLIGGSLIGAVRDGGMLPWDDDIDVGLLYDDYNKLIKLLSKEKNEDYQLFTNKINKSYYYPFAKLVSKKTFLHEDKNIDKIDGYGIFIDILCYSNMPDNRLLQRVHYALFNISNKMIIRTKLDAGRANFFHKISRSLKNIVSTIVGYRLLIGIENRIHFRFNNRRHAYVFSNWPIYGFKRELQKRSSFDGYMDIMFDDVKVMIISGYDDFLTTSFGNYMVPPAKKDQCGHKLQAYWRDDSE